MTGFFDTAKLRILMAALASFLVFAMVSTPGHRLNCGNFFLYNAFRTSTLLSITTGPEYCVMNIPPGKILCGLIIGRRIRSSEQRIE